LNLHMGKKIVMKNWNLKPFFFIMKNVGNNKIYMFKGGMSIFNYSTPICLMYLWYISIFFAYQICWWFLKFKIKVSHKGKVPLKTRWWLCCKNLSLENNAHYTYYVDQ
jgi:hypothetical protein